MIFWEQLKEHIYKSFKSSIMIMHGWFVGHIIGGWWNTGSIPALDTQTWYYYPLMAFTVLCMVILTSAMQVYLDRKYGSDD